MNCDVVYVGFGVFLLYHHMLRGDAFGCHDAGYHDARFKLITRVIVNLRPISQVPY